MGISLEFDRERAASIAPAVRMLVKSGNTSIVTFRANEKIREMDFSHCIYEPLLVQGCGDLEAQYAALKKGIMDYNARTGKKPEVVAVEGLGFFACGRTKEEADNIVSAFMGIVPYAQKTGVREVCGKRAQEKIVIVTGAAQGFGKEISEGLAAEGANVVIADINGEGARETSLELKSLYGEGKSMAVSVDVTDENSVKEMVVNTVLEYGGLDIFISNAGIVKSGSLEEMDVKSFELVSKVNYTGYFLGAKHASKPMKIQNRFDKEYYMDIIQLNSKSGLAGSNKNFAYAGSKFGGIGLTQSFAMELVGYNIKVNAVCPGNFLEGPLWSDPKNGLFIQYLNSGKVPGAKNVEDVKRYYESKVPMGRGCRPKDVVRAILYIMEQEYETGQAVPVTGGQHMLR